MSGAEPRQLIVSEQADVDTDDIAFYLALQSEETGRRFFEAVAETYGFLLENPGVGRRRDRASLEETVIQQWAVRGFPNHLIFYHAFDNGIKILRVLHGARNLPNLLD